MHVVLNQDVVNKLLSGRGTPFVSVESVQAGCYRIFEGWPRLPDVARWERDQYFRVFRFRFGGW